MKYKTMLSIALLCELSGTGCRKECDSYTYVETQPVFKRYFDVYKSGSWWVYLNRDSSKRDSIFISDFRQEIYKVSTTCLSGIRKKFKINSAFAFPPGTNIAEYQTDGSSIYKNTFLIRDIGVNNYFIIYAFADTDSLVNGVSSGSVRLSNYRLWPALESSTIPVVTLEGPFILAPGVGIVQFISPVSKDTFSLSKFQVE